MHIPMVSVILTDNVNNSYNFKETGSNTVPPNLIIKPIEYKQYSAYNPK